jgi:PAS domain S-box-containing protein
MNDHDVPMQKQENEEFAVWLRTSTTIGAIVFLALSALDFVVFPELASKFFAYRIIIAAYLGVTALLSIKCTKPGLQLLLALLATIASSATIEAMILQTGGHASPYAAGMILLVVCILAYAQGGMAIYVVASLAIYAIYVLPIIAAEHITDFRSFFASNFFLFAIILVMIVLRYLAQRNTRKLNAGRRRAEQSLRESEARYRAIFEQSPDGVLLVDSQGTIVDFNDQVNSQLGYTREEFSKLRIEDIDPVESPKDISARFDMVTREGKAEFEVEHKTKSGEVRDVQVITRTVAVAGQAYHHTIWRDVTERKNAESVLRRSHEQLEILVKERTAELTMMNEQLRNLSTYLQNAREEERMKIARDIHDELGQSLTAIKLELAFLRKKLPKDQNPITQKADYIAKLVESTIQSVKRISAELRPGILDHIDLSSAIEWHAKEFEKRNGIPCTVVFEPEEIHLDRDRSTAVYRIFQETLTNVTRHANASKVEALLKLQTGELLLRVQDDGKGIAEQHALDAKSLGLIGMRERVHYWGGSFAIQGIPNKGTSVFVRIPLDKTGEAPDKHA